MSRTALAAEVFALLRESRMAYIKEIRSEDAALLYPEAPLLEPGQRIFALHLADGTPIVLAESRESALKDAQSHRLEAVSVH